MRLANKWRPNWHSSALCALCFLLGAWTSAFAHGQMKTEQSMLVLIKLVAKKVDWPAQQPSYSLAQPLMTLFSSRCFGGEQFARMATPFMHHAQLAAFTASNFHGTNQIKNVPFFAFPPVVSNERQQPIRSTTQTQPIPGRRATRSPPKPMGRRPPNWPNWQSRNSIN